MFNCSSSSIPVTTWCVCMYYAMYCGGALIKNHGPCSGRAGHAADGPSAAARPRHQHKWQQSPGVIDSLETLASISNGSWHCWQVKWRINVWQQQWAPYCHSGCVWRWWPDGVLTLTLCWPHGSYQQCSGELLLYGHLHLVTVLLRMRWWNVGRCLFTCWHPVRWPATLATVSKMSKEIWGIAHFWHLVPRRIAVVQCTVMIRITAKLAAASTTLSTAWKNRNALTKTSLALLHFRPVHKLNSPTNTTFNVGSRASVDQNADCSLVQLILRQESCSCWHEARPAREVVVNIVSTNFYTKCAGFTAKDVS